LPAGVESDIAGAGSGEPAVKKKILLIEDESVIVEAITFLLEYEGMEVVSHSDGAGAARLAANIQPDLIILDAMLPNISGFDIITEIRSADATARIPVMMLTARGQARDREAALDAGVTRFMTKPFANKEMVETAHALMAARPKQAG
jgi:DNA-binding response OmpR family regulator